MQMKKWQFIAAGFMLFISASCSSPGKPKEEAAKAEGKSTASVTVEKSVKPAAVESDGQKLYAQKGCLVCHRLDTKLVGPAVKDIAAAYSGDKAALVAFLKGQGKAIVDPSQASVMQPQVEITKALPAAELDAIADYILSVK